MFFRIKDLFGVLCVVAGLSGPAMAQQATTDQPTIGPETNRPLPRYVSLKAGEANVRRGPSLSHRIDWVFQRKGMPLQVVAEYGHWRRVIDRDGQGGWVHYTMLTGARTVIVEEESLFLHARANVEARQTAELRADVVARIRKCDSAWCEIAAGGYKGWAPKTALWGVEADEVIN